MYNLLYNYLCASIPHKLKCSIYRVDDAGVGWRDAVLTGFYDLSEFYFDKDLSVGIYKIKPYLRKLSSLTKDEVMELQSKIFTNPKGGRYFYIDKAYECLVYDGPDNQCAIGITDDTISLLYDWLYEHHIDIYGLIDKGLAIEVTEENNPYIH